MSFISDIPVQPKHQAKLSMSSVATDKKNTDCIMRAGISPKLMPALLVCGQ